MKRPEMIIFDYGHTLLYEPGFDAMRCEEAAYPYIIENPQNLTAEQIYGEVQRVFAKVQEQRNAGISQSFPITDLSLSWHPVNT